MFPNLKAEQARKGMTNEQMAKLLKMSRVTYERKKRVGNFTVSEARALCEFFGIDFQTLFATDDKAS